MLAYKIKVKGIVQSVGFRPFIYNLALKYDIKGWVNNDDEGVNILLSSDEKSCKLFINELRINPPRLSVVDSIEIKKIIIEKSYTSFEIIDSKITNSKTTIISPDIAICEDCLNEINDKNNFRHNYPLTNCTNCGPRYSIIKTVPYDRKNTSMNIFNLCKKCNDEYINPLNRRYHAQPISCNKCGPDVFLYKYNNKMSKGLDSIKTIAKYIEDGCIVAIKGIGGFHIVCDATNDKTVKELRIRKNRINKPFAVLFKDIEEVKKYTEIKSEEENFLRSKEKPIILLKKRKNTNISYEVSQNIDTLGCFISYTGIHHLLFKYLSIPIIATSANLKGEPILVKREEIVENLSGIVDFILDYDRDIVNSCDDSVIQIVDKNILKIRNARGYAPSHINIVSKYNKKILALGGNQKSTISIYFKNNLILSPYIGDLNSIKSMDYFNRTINTFKNFYDFEADVIVCDKHPTYQSTKYARTLDKKLIQVQHHYSHILSCMAEYELKEDVLGFAFDGTGYGDDGNIWGGEVFICNQKKYTRIKHLKYFKLIGGEIAIKEPKRIALSLLFDTYSLEKVLQLDSEFLKSFKPNEIKLFYKMWKNDLNTIKTSSIGRLFDAIAIIAGLLDVQTYEAQSGLLIEKYYNEEITTYYEYDIINSEIDFSKMIKSIIKEKDKIKICSKFINTIGQVILEISIDNKDLPVVLSGGVFQNKKLLSYCINLFRDHNRVFYYSKKIPLNDEGISVGQIYHLL